MTVNRFETARIATEHLIAHGHRQLVLVMPTGSTMSRDEKIAGFFAAANAACLSASARLVEGAPAGGFGEESMGEFARHQAGLLAGIAERPTGPEHARVSGEISLNP